MGELFEIALAYFQEQDWPVEVNEERTVLRLYYQCASGSWHCYGTERAGADQFIFIAVVPEKAPEDRRSAIAEYLTRANWGLSIGNFEMDFSDGEIRFKTGIDVTHDRLTSGLVDPLVKASLVSMEDHVPAIQSVIAGQATPEEALESVFKTIEEDDEYDLIL